MRPSPNLKYFKLRKMCIIDSRIKTNIKGEKVTTKCTGYHTLYYIFFVRDEVSGRFAEKPKIDVIPKFNVYSNAILSNTRNTHL